jgi:hypothetical protein
MSSHRQVSHSYTFRDKERAALRFLDLSAVASERRHDIEVGD